jgi:hypothetical protein
LRRLRNLVCAAGHPRLPFLLIESPEDVDGRDKPGHDESMFHQHIVYDCGKTAIFRAKNPDEQKIFGDYQP